jgi:ectoine hydroxylase-related dioxygenase (phytanoyl-CoA dioxygenase family)
VKPPLSPARVEWHQDHTYTGFIEECVSVRMALTDCTPQSGCLRVLDGSHRLGFRGDLRALTALEVSDDSRHMPEGDVVEVELRAGDVSVHHCLTFHSSAENRSERPRMTLIARMFDARRKLVVAKVPPGLEAWFPTDADGHLTGPTFPLL